MGVYGIMIGGWASNNKFSLLAAIRGASQIISYELAMGLVLIALLMLTGIPEPADDCGAAAGGTSVIMCFTSRWVF